MASRSVESPAPTARTDLTTREAAQLMGVSVGTVLNMVARGELPAWRTSGGHRRVHAAAADALAAQRRASALASARRADVLVVEDEPFIRESYAELFDQWRLPVDLRLCEDGLQALLEIGRRPPDLLLLDLRMPQMDGFEVIRRLRSERRYARGDLVVVTGLGSQAIAASGGLPPDVVVWTKPLRAELLRGYLDAKLGDWLAPRWSA